MRLREAARLLLLDERDHVLLLRADDDGTIVNPNYRVPATFWVTVGGGLQPGESFEQAARREAFEETGIITIELGPWLWEREQVVIWAGEPVRAYERYYLGRVQRTAIVFDHVTEEERGVLRQFRWWSVAELYEASSTETFLPPGLPRLLADALAGLPERPITL